MPEFNFDDIKEHIQLDYNAVYDQRDKANEAIRFADVPGGQWEDWQPRNPINRPRFEFNLVSKAIKRAMGEWVNNRIRVKYRPDSNNASEKDAKILNGLYRRDERRSGGFEAYDNGVEDMFKCGVGGWKLKTELSDYSDLESNEQNIVFEPIYAAYNTMVWDSQAKRYDKADAKRCTILEYFTPDAFEKEWPDATPVSFNRPNDRRAFNWFSPKEIVVAKHYEVVEKKMDQVLYRNEFGAEKQVWLDEVKDIIDELADEGFEEVIRRKRKKKQVWMTVMNGTEFLEKPQRIPGTMIPIVPIYGFRSWIDGHEWFRGITQELMDANRLFNSAVTRIGEAMSTSIKEVPLFSSSQVEGLENYLAEAHTANYPYLVLNASIIDGEEQPIPQPPTLKPPQVDPNTAATIDIVSGFINEETGGAPQDVTDPDASGKAINAVIQRVDMQTAVLMDNIAKSMKRCGEIYRDIAREVYDTTRYFKIIEENGEEADVLLRDYVIDRQSGEPVMVNDITKGEYEVISDTGPAYASKRQENVATLRDIHMAMSDADPLKSSVMSLLIENLDVDGIEDLQGYVRKQMLLQGIRQPESDEDYDTLEAAQAAQQGPSEQEQLIASLAQEAQSKAQEAASKAQLNIANANKAGADTARILSDIQLDKFNASQEAIQRQYERRMGAVDRLLQ